jgi:chromate transport protein ChrA
MNKIVKNPFIDALFKLMLLSANIHIIILFAYSIFHKNTDLINAFKILDLQLVFPSLLTVPYSLYISFIVMGIVYFLIFWLSNRDK